MTAENTENTPGHYVDEDAPVVVRLSTTVDAPLATVWDLHTDIGSWADWNTDIESVDFGGPLAPGASFRWLTHGLDITSTIREVVPGERIVWGGPAHGIEGVHVWTFEETGEGTVTVRTEESWAGAPVEERPEEMREALRQSLESWLSRLRSEAERRR
ncbi:SRPBCC family protein [Streptomyces sp. IB201691-2A2]|uniref:SRPBCC family protein n=1 Tax=Streptomyces sp. IB201691-2A2 TaxID=2561920 RepID=UPI001180E969|nr:SRPBCC family protein [Streptomyces sp. IB201691-2A2]TRO62995.1 Shy6-polyketide cyclase [Streptomyces sp. IB201691-2A2]